MVAAPWATPAPQPRPPTLPRHVAIIMDGNGRWASRRGLPRLAGHRAGVEPVRQVVRACGELGVEALTLYTFSTENWKRPRGEVLGLMRLLRRFLVSELKELSANGVRLRAIGEIDGLPRLVREELANATRATADNKGLQLVLAVNYSGRRELAHAVAQVLRERATTNSDAEISEAELEREIASKLYAPDLPDPDLLIRTSGELRLSNFMAWQTAYTEIYVTDVLWPDFRREHLTQALEAYAGRERRFGAVPALRSAS